MFKKAREQKAEFEALKRMLNFTICRRHYWDNEPDRYRITLPDGTVVETDRDTTKRETYNTSAILPTKKKGAKK